MKTLLLLAVCPVLALANGGGYITGVKSTGAFQPIGIDQVEMLSERLEIDLHVEYADIRIEYVLHNPARKVKIEAGFPSAIVTDTRFIPGEMRREPVTSKPTLQAFELFADSKPVKVDQKADQLQLDKPTMYGGAVVNSWHTFRLDFDAGQTRRLLVSYRNPYYGMYSSVSDNESVSALTLTYLFSSAGAWRGPIRQGNVVITTRSVTRSQITISHPSRFVTTDKGWTWNFTDFEPTLEDDLVIAVRPSYSTQPVTKEIPSKEPGESDYVYLGRYVCANDRLNATADAYDGDWSFHRQDYEVVASSHLPPDGDLDYSPANLKNSDRATAWTEGVPGDGRGESLTLTLPKPAKIRRVGIVNGYAKSNDLYHANGRVAEFDVSVNGGKAVRVGIPDEHLQQEHFFFDLPPTKDLVKTIKLTIAGVYAGTRFQDTAISSITLVQPLDKAPKIQAVR